MDDKLGEKQKTIQKWKFVHHHHRMIVVINRICIDLIFFFALGRSDDIYFINCEIEEEKKARQMIKNDFRKNRCRK